MVDEASSSSRTRKNQNHDPLPESSDDTLVAVQSLMQMLLGDEYISDDVSGKRKRVSSLDEEEVGQTLPNADITPSAKKIKKTFENDIEVVAGPKNVKKYRPLANIYKVTTPIIHPAKN